jgi:DNA topoisomerase-1
VQSVALRLVCDREDERQLFNAEEYWSIAADFTAAAAAAPGSSSADVDNISGYVDNAPGVSLTARLVQVDGKRLQAMSIGSHQAADSLVARLWQQKQQDASNTAAGSSSDHSGYETAESVLYRVASVVRKPVKRNPPPPLVTSSLQQEAGRRLGWGASKTMLVAQQLYEGANTGGTCGTYHAQIRLMQSVTCKPHVRICMICFHATV